ncbi:MAG TPA: shikimate kinase [Acidobacteriaceae bacterium]|jgi:shikimate kinase|nr:shikimate kinase [Acidobacteriaceae bacterium]
MSGPGPSTPIAGIILTGFMGAGKTTAGALLAERLRWRFVDSDGVVESRAGMSVAVIFARQGEAAFRDLEAEAIRETAQTEQVVLALGGGALERAQTRDFLAGLAAWRVVFLEAPLETLLSRCAGQEDGPVRPVLRDRERLAERWAARLPWYRQAHVTVATEGRAPEAVVAGILDALGFAEADGPAPRARGSQAASSRLRQEKSA